MAQLIYSKGTQVRNDEYMTPKGAWEDIQMYIPGDKLIWEAFYGDGTSGQYLRELGFDVIHEDVDFYSRIPSADEICVSNPPFSGTQKILQRLVDIDMPFILILPSSKINTQYFRNIFANRSEPIQLIVPKKRISFRCLTETGTYEQSKSGAWFDCFYYCWKMDLPRDIMWL